jgi:hypothetical protein
MIYKSLSNETSCTRKKYITPSVSYHDKSHRWLIFLYIMFLSVDLI